MAELVSDQRLESYFGLLKFLLGTVGIGYVTLKVNASLRDKELTLHHQNRTAEMEMQRAKEDGEYLEKFVTYALEDNIGRRRRFALFFKTVTSTPQQRSRWQDYYNIVDKEYADLQKKEAEQLDKLQKSSADLKAVASALTADTEADHAKIRELRDSRAAAEKQLEMARAELAKIRANLAVKPLRADRLEQFVVSPEILEALSVMKQSPSRKADDKPAKE